MTQQINLYNPIFRRKKFSFTSATAMLYGVGIAAALAALIAVYENYRLREIQTQAQAVERSLKEESALRDKLAAERSAHKPNAQLEAELARLNALLKNRQEIVEALKSGGVGTAGGFSEYMRAFSRQTVNGLWLTGFDIAGGGDELSLSGRTLNAELVPNYLKRLNQEKPMQGRQFAAMRINQPPPGLDAAKAGDKEAKAPPPPPRYLEFTISTGAIEDIKTQATQPLSQQGFGSPAPSIAAKAVAAAEASK